MTGTFEREDELPRVPLPDLDHAYARFLEWCAPLLDEDQLARTKEAVEHDLAEDSSARRLHAELTAYDGRPGVGSWLDDFWDDRYLGRRDRIALNANFFFQLADRDLGQVERAAELTTRAVAFKRLVDEERLPVEEQRGKPLSMVQYRYLFSADRLPGPDRDTASTPYTDERPGPSRARHVLVLHRGRMHRLDVLDEDDRPYPAATLADAFRAVLGDDRPVDPDGAAGALTTLPRPEWAAVRERVLAADPENAAALAAVTTALFVVVLEDGTPEDVHAACDQLLHGDPTSRWFDKSLSLVVFGDGRAGLNGEHCRLDGTTVIGLIAGLLDPEHPAATPTAEPAEGEPALTPVQVVLTDDLRAEVRRAVDGFAEAAADTATLTVSVDGRGTDAAKAAGVSPDGFTQMAFQVAHARSRDRVGATYESISTRHLHHGRTEAMRVVTPEVVRLVEALDGDRDAAVDALRTAVDAHVARARQCQAGDAPEQYLWELQLLRRRHHPDLEPPAVHDSPGWAVLREDYLSTSAVPSVHVSYFGFGATSNTCIGIGYALLPDRLTMFLSTRREVADLLPAFAEQVGTALEELSDLL